MDLTEKLKSAISAQDERELENIYLIYQWFKYITWNDDLSNIIDDQVSKENAHAFFLKGCIYDYGLGVAMDEEKAMPWYLKAHECGHSFASNNIGRMYQTGMGVRKNIKIAEKWFLIAAKQNCASAHNNLGCIYSDDFDIGINYKKAMNYFVKGINLGSPVAEGNLANLLHTKSKQLAPIIYEMMKSIDELKEENLELKLRPPPEGGELYVEAKNRFKKRKK
jgi:TPR repeat protein